MSCVHLLTLNRFMHFLHTHLVTGSYRTCYADTDSMCLALTAGLSFNKHDSLEKQLTAMFDPIVRPEMRESWETQWKQWFVTTDNVEDQRWPGKLKVEFTIQKGTNQKLYKIYSIF